MKQVTLAVVVMLICGCTYTPPTAPATTQPVQAQPAHAFVQIEGIDGTQMNGELLNGSVTIDCGQGPLTLLTDHIYYITFANDGDTVASKSVKVTGKIRETQFDLQTEHGVFTLEKERLKRIDFPQNPQPSATPPSKQPSTTEQGYQG